MNIAALISKLSAPPPLRVRPSEAGNGGGGGNSSSDESAGGGGGRHQVDGNTVFGAGRSDASEAASDASTYSRASSTARTRSRTNVTLPQPPAAAPQPQQRQPARTTGEDDDSEGLADEIQWARTRPEPDWVTTPDVQIFRSLIEGEPQPPHRCVGCCYERGDSFAIHYDTWRQLNAMILGKFRRMDRLQMAREIKHFFDKHIWAPTQPPNPVPEGCIPVPAWDLATILEHYEHHDTHPAMRLIKRIDQISRILDRMYEENMCYHPRSRTGRFMRDAHGKKRVRVHGGSLRDFLAVCAAEERLDKLLGRGAAAGAEEDIRPFLQLEGRKFVLDNVAGFDCTAPDAQMGGAAQGGTVSGQGKKRRVL